MPLRAKRSPPTQGLQTGSGQSLLSQAQIVWRFLEANPTNFLSDLPYQVWKLSSCHWGSHRINLDQNHNECKKPPLKESQIIQTHQNTPKQPHKTTHTDQLIQPEQPSLKQTIFWICLDFTWTCKLPSLFYLKFCSYQESDGVISPCSTLQIFCSATHATKTLILCQKAAAHQPPAPKWKNKGFGLPSPQLPLLAALKPKLSQLPMAMEDQPHQSCGCDCYSCYKPCYKLLML